MSVELTDPASPRTDGAHSRTISVVVADNRPLVLRAMLGLLQKEADIGFAAGVVTGAEAMRAIREHQPDVGVLSLHMPGTGALDVIAALTREALKTRFVVLAARMNEEEFLRSAALDVRALVLTGTSGTSLARCVRTVHEGGEFLEKELFAALLTPRERDVVECAIGGLSSRDVAQRLGLAERAVFWHQQRVYEKLRVRGCHGLVKLERQDGPHLRFDISTIARARAFARAGSVTTD